MGLSDRNNVLMRNLLFLIALLLPTQSVGEPLRVFVSVLPQKTFVEKIGADHVEVRAMVRPGYNPHTYDPTPQQIAALTTTAVYICIGVPFEHAWMERIRSANPEMQVLDGRKGIDLREIEDFDRAGRDRHYEAGNEADPGLRSRDAHESDPHIWTSPILVKRLSATIRDKLSELDPKHVKDYSRNYDTFAAELDVLDHDIRALLENLSNRKFMVFHPAWGYFANTYGLIQVPIEKEGKEPGPRALAALIDQAKREKVKVVFVQPQFSEKSAAEVARAIGGRVVAIDPLSPDYVDNLRNVARQIARAIQR